MNISINSDIRLIIIIEVNSYQIYPLITKTSYGIIMTTINIIKEIQAFQIVIKILSGEKVGISLTHLRN